VCSRSIGARPFQQRLKLINDGGRFLDLGGSLGRDPVAERSGDMNAYSPSKPGDGRKVTFRVCLKIVEGERPSRLFPMPTPKEKHAGRPYTVRRRGLKMLTCDYRIDH
jgi:hypothetical protein